MKALEKQFNFNIYIYIYILAGLFAHFPSFASDLWTSYTPVIKHGGVQTKLYFHKKIKKDMMRITIKAAPIFKDVKQDLDFHCHQHGRLTRETFKIHETSYGSICVFEKSKILLRKDQENLYFYKGESPLSSQELLSFLKEAEL